MLIVPANSCSNTIKELRGLCDDWNFLKYQLKNGSRIGTRQFDHADDLRKCLTFDAVTACYIHDLNTMEPGSADPGSGGGRCGGLPERVPDVPGNSSLSRPSRSRPRHPDLRHRWLPAHKKPALPGTRKLWQAYDMFVPVLVYHRGRSAREPPR